MEGEARSTSSGSDSSNNNSDRVKLQKTTRRLNELREEKKTWEEERKELRGELARVVGERERLAEEAQTLLELTFVSYARQAHERPGRDKKSNSMKGECID